MDEKEEEIVIESLTRASFSIAREAPEDDGEEKKGLKGDYANLCLLIFFYSLQGLQGGLWITIPMILASNNVSYNKQAIFSFAVYPYTIKLLWAPIVDSLYFPKFGR
ncbi:acetyl-coenzyme A transporter 1-like protein, partial [Dinothrombium tinctorium]